jgi:putative DNA primase/helicase
MLAQIRAFLEAHGASRFTSWDARDDARTVNRAGYRKDTDDGPEFYVEREVFRNELAKGFDARAVAQALREVGALKPDVDGGATRVERLPDGRKTRVYRVGPALWSTP